METHIKDILDLYLMNKKGEILVTRWGHFNGIAEGMPTRVFVLFVASVAFPKRQMMPNVKTLSIKTFECTLNDNSDFQTFLNDLLVKFPNTLNYFFGNLIKFRVY